MRFEWDPEKARSNLAKHGFRLEEAAKVFDDPLAEAQFNSVVDGEERWEIIGRVGSATILLVIFSNPLPEDETLVRIISVRKAMKGERKAYDDNQLR
jgi:hypothetical protein